MQWEGDNENSKGPQLKCRIWLHLPSSPSSQPVPSIQGVSQRPPPPRSSPDFPSFLLKLCSTPLLFFAKRGRRCWYSLPFFYPSFLSSFYSFYSFILPSIHLSIHLSHLPIFLSTHPSTHATIHSFTQPPSHPLIHPSTHPPIYPSMNLVIHRAMHPSIHESVIHLAIHPSIHSALRASPYRPLSKLWDREITRLLQVPILSELSVWYEGHKTRNKSTNRIPR